MVVKITKYRISGTTDGSGDSIDFSNVIRGNIKAVQFAISGLAAGAADITITTDDEVSPQTIINLTNTNVNQTIYPRRPAEDIDGTDFLYVAGGQIVPVEFTVFSKLKCVIADGGAAAKYVIDILVEEN